MGQTTTAIGDNLYGFNHRQMPSLIQINKDHYGMTFFTRPRLNFTDGNLRVLRKLAPLLSTNPTSYQRYIRCLLDPVGNLSGAYTTPLFDAKQAFMTILGNMLISLPGWPDITMAYSTSQEGIMKEQFALADGTTDIYRIVELTANFRNMQNDPITTLFDYWLTYMKGVYLGDIVPYPEAILENEVDYQTRIYRFVLDSTKRFIYRVAATGAGFPVSSPLGASFNYEAHQDLGPVNDGLKEVSVHFVNMGVMYNDDILLYEFNLTGEAFNPSLADITPAMSADGKTKIANNARSPLYQKIAIDELPLFNYRGYPRIDLGTYELEWFVDKQTYQQILPLVLQYYNQLKT
jgi:hypothetical protein